MNYRHNREIPNKTIRLIEPGVWSVLLCHYKYTLLIQRSSGTYLQNKIMREWSPVHVHIKKVRVTKTKICHKSNSNSITPQKTKMKLMMLIMLIRVEMYNDSFDILSNI